MSLNLLQWVCKNKLLILFMLCTVCLFISTLALSSRTIPCGAVNIDEITQESINSSKKATGKDIENASAYYRLPRYIEPKNYKLTLKPNVTKNTFDGSVIISINILHSTKKITLHSKELSVHSITLSDNDGRDVRVRTMDTTTDKREFLFVNLEKDTMIGNYTLRIKYEGRLDKGIVGFYSSNLKAGGTMVASKFQPTYARQAFPCFDEPDFKATYDITLVKPQSYVALSNMNEISKEIDNETKTEAVTFATSVPMSTYLACFVICDFDFKEAEINTNGIGKNFKLRSFAQKNQMHKIDFAQDIGKRATEFYINYYEVPFPLPKLDMIAIPDYVSGATEHWGLVTYRETSFLVDEATASAANKISVANTIAHELAHMWFGNLVTMKWWDEVWLNEGFASYMQVKSLNALEPTWTMLDQFLVKTLHSVLVTDAKLASHPIVQTVSTPDQITAIFDSISYNKGASILRMLEGFIGEENFRRGVSDYLKKYEFGNTVTQDLLSSLEPYFKNNNPNLNISYIMDTWTRQMGYPLLTVEKGKDPNTYVVKQKRFLIDPDAKYPNDSPFNYKWFVPITYKTNNGRNKDLVWFPDTIESIKLTMKDGDKWVKLNNNQVGYYRVNYPDEMWETLIDQLMNKSEHLTISDRANLLNDVFALAETRHVSYDLALKLIGYLKVEEDYVPWETASSTFSDLGSRLLNSLALTDFEKYVQGLLEPLYIKQSWEKSDNGVIEGLLRTKILSQATRWHLPEAEAKVKEMFMNWLNSHAATGVEVEPELRSTVYYYGMQSASMTEWDKLWQIYLKAEDAQELAKLRRALAAPRDVNILRRYLMLSWDEKNVRSQDYLNVVQYISSNPAGTALIWDDVRARWPKLVERFTLNSRYLGNIIPAITQNFDTELKLKEMEAFFSEYPEAGAGEAGRRRALETVRNNIRWAATHKTNIENWLKSHSRKL